LFELAIKAVFFDFDGVLWDSEVAALDSWRETYAWHGQDLQLDHFATRVGTVGGTDLVAELERLVGTSLDREVELRRWQRKMELVRELKPRPGILDYIAEARRRGLAVAIVSTDDTEWIMTGLTILGSVRCIRFHRVRRRRQEPGETLPRAVPQRVRSVGAVG
jgi:beta-phosphoglucomutase-like phosphatase (HAD superfamily)